MRSMDERMNEVFTDRIWNFKKKLEVKFIEQLRNVNKLFLYCKYTV